MSFPKHIKTVIIEMHNVLCFINFEYLHTRKTEIYFVVSDF